MLPFPENLRGREVHLVGLTSLEIADVACFLGRRQIGSLVGHDLAEPDALHEHFRAAHIGMEPPEREAHWEALSALPIDLRLGPDYLRDITAAEIIIVSQAWRLYPKNAPLAQLAERLVSPLAIYLDLARSRGIRTLGVTGSNGKSTTTNMAAAMLREAGRPLVLAGNYRYRGPILEDLAELPSAGILVLEVSNHHLMSISHTTDVAVVTNVTPNHLEEHDGFEGYVAVKRRMAECQPDGGTLVLNADDPVSREFASAARGTVLRFGTSDIDACDAALVDGKLAWRGAGAWEPWLDATALRVPGLHNVQNALAASLAARTFGVTAATVASALRTFAGVPGRLELVREVAGMRLLWDVESTTPESTVRALESFPAGTVHLIAGGDDKGGLEYGPLASAIARHRATLRLLAGTATEAMRQACRLANVAWRDAASLEDAVNGAWEVAAEGDVVLVSPAAKGFYNAHVRGQTSIARIAKRLRSADRGIGSLAAVLPEPVRRHVAWIVNALSPTPLEWRADLGCWLKHEELGEPPTHKSRGLLVEVALARAEGARGVVISSSGNAALAAGYWCRRLGVRGLAFLSDRTESAKIERVRLAGLDVVVAPKPRNFSTYAARYAGLTDLRPSLHPLGGAGYRMLAVELVRQLRRAPSDVFCFVNSGVTLEGMAEGFAALKGAGRIDGGPALHAVQCTASPGLAEAVGAPLRPEESPLAGALGAQTPANVAALAAAIQESGGGAWMVLNDEIASAAAGARDAGLLLAVETEAALAGLLRAREAGRVGDTPVVVAGGLAAEVDWSPGFEPHPAPGRVWVVESYGDVRSLLVSLGLDRVDV